MRGAAPPDRAVEARPLGLQEAGRCRALPGPSHLISEEGGGRQVQQEALCKGPGTCVTKGMLSKAQGSDSVQEMQGLPQQLGTPAPNGPKIPSADEGILSAAGGSRQLEG